MLATRFWINSIGEYGHDNADGADIDYGGSVDVNECKARGLTIEQAFALQKQEICRNQTELLLLEEFDRLQPPETGMWRLYGSVLYGSTVKVNLHLSIEFSHDDSDEDFWKRLEATATLFGFNVDEMWVHPPETGYWNDIPANFDQLTHEERIKLPSYVPSPEEGTCRRQVDCYRDIRGLALEERDRIMAEFEAATEGFWKEAGVVVL